MKKTIEKQEMKSTTNSYVYRRLLQWSFGCEYCGANRGCNRHAGSYYQRNWKHYRDKQYKS